MGLKDLFKRKKKDEPLPFQAEIKPFDLVLFIGNDFISTAISSVQRKHVDSRLMKQGSPLWHHAGVVIDKSVLPLECLVDGRLYIYESVFSGTILGFEYSKHLPVDNPKALLRKRKAGPQIRDLFCVLEETAADVAICPLVDKARRKIYSLPELQERMLQFHEKFGKYSYPFSIVPQFAAANDKLFDIIQGFKDTFSNDDEEDEESIEDVDQLIEMNQSIFKVSLNLAGSAKKHLVNSNLYKKAKPEVNNLVELSAEKAKLKYNNLLTNTTKNLNKSLGNLGLNVDLSNNKKQDHVEAIQRGDSGVIVKSDCNIEEGIPVQKKKKFKKTVFCSEFAACIYKAVDLEGFEQPGRFTPVEVENSKSHGDSYYVKLDNKTLLLTDNIKVCDGVFVKNHVRVVKR
ncbi:hypothetical protein HK099_002567 [Clydaea vesicula]|uniref:Uncharacterized protein n=1 Tax=Clydaea vesicula TaxID=447962 RepID=A0AAD5U2C9_9FUNG|nr:hypothetical protein HK099_002567 [Clydaea vesicula]